MCPKSMVKHLAFDSLYKETLSKTELYSLYIYIQHIKYKIKNSLNSHS